MTPPKSQAEAPAPACRLHLEQGEEHSLSRFETENLMGPIAGIRSLAPTVSPTSRGAGEPWAQAETQPTRPPATPADAPASDSAGSRPGGGRPLATFLSHLIATAQDAPQTRQLRRAAVSEALSAYVATAGLVEGATARRGASGAARAA